MKFYFLFFLAFISLVPFLYSMEQTEHLLDAVIAGNKKLVKKILLLKANSEACDTNKATPLHYAAGLGHTSIIKVLIDHGARKDVPDMFKMRPLHYAVMSNQLEAARLLITAGAAKNVQDIQGHTCLHVACNSNNVEMVKLFLSLCINTEVRSTCGETALLSAVDRGNINICTLLVQAGANVNARNFAQSSALYLASFMATNFPKHAQLMDTLLYSKALIAQDPKKDEIVSNIKMTFEYIKEPNSALESMTPLMWAAIRNNASVIQSLLGYSCFLSDANSSGDTAWTLAHKYKNTQVITELTTLFEQLKEAILQSTLMPLVLTEIIGQYLYGCKLNLQ